MTREFSLAGYSDRVNRVLIRVTRLSVLDRLRRAVFGLLAAWGVALVSAFIPVAHFVLVPGLLLFGLLLFFKGITTTQRASGACCACPDCGVEQELDLSGQWTLPFALTCRSCQRRLTLSEDAQGF